MPEFQLEQFLARIDREMVDVSGLNDLLRGLAPGVGDVIVQGHQRTGRQLRDAHLDEARPVLQVAQGHLGMVRRVWAAKEPDLEGVLLGPGDSTSWLHR